MEIPITINTFVPGGRRFTLITPLPRDGRPANVVMPVLAPDSSFGDIAHLVHVLFPKYPHSNAV